MKNKFLFLAALLLFACSNESFDSDIIAGSKKIISCYINENTTYEISSNACSAMGGTQSPYSPPPADTSQSQITNPNIENSFSINKSLSQVSFSGGVFTEGGLILDSVKIELDDITYIARQGINGTALSLTNTAPISLNTIDCGWHTVCAIAWVKDKVEVASRKCEQFEKLTEDCLEPSSSSNIPSSSSLSPSSSSSLIIREGSGEFRDTRDSKTYRYITIPTLDDEITEQVWMAQNLDFRIEGSSQCYGEDDANCDTYGSLYDWATVMQGEASTYGDPNWNRKVKGICPDGWHLPNQWEFETLQAFINYDNGCSNINSNSACGGKILKAESGWNDYIGGASGNGTDKYGFMALPGGFFDSEGGEGFLEKNSTAYWWTATQYNASSARSINIRTDEILNTNSIIPKINLLSVRCVKNP